MSGIVLTTADVRRIFLDRQRMGRRLKGRLTVRALTDLIADLGFVQVDSIDTLARAHHAILFARHGGYRADRLTQALERRRSLFEGWTHDASIVPTAFWPMWRRHFEREHDRLARRWRDRHALDADRATAELLTRIADDGPLKARDLAPPDRASGGWWDWHPGKAGLEFLWRTGRLAVTRREGFEKVYDLAERVLPAEATTAPVPSRAALIDWACRGALARLGVATSGELAAYWGLIDAAEAKRWAEGAPEATAISATLRPSTARRSAPRAPEDGGDRAVLVHPTVMETPIPSAPTAMRIVSPFDPIVRDRKRALRLFGFDYRIEVFVPAARRRYGYYVFPVLDGERFVARIDMQADRKAGRLRVRRIFWEPGIRVTSRRSARLTEALSEIAVWAGLEPSVLLPTD